MTTNNTVSNGDESDHPTLQRERALAIVFGASEWPDHPEFHAAPSFRRSASEFIDYLRGQNGLNLSRRNVKVLFDSFDDAPDIVRQMYSFIRDRRKEAAELGRPITDLLIYYIGHGGITFESNAFFMAIRSTHEDDPLATSITAESLGRLIREGASGLRTYLVLDCCFAASVTKVFMSSGPLGVAGVQLRDKLPPQGDSFAFEAGKWPEYGIGLLCASGSSEPAKAPPDLPHTMFTGGLLDVLRNGDTAAPAWLSLDDIQRLVRARLEEQFSKRAVLPQVHAPQQRMGRVDLVPLFRNPSRPVVKAALAKPDAAEIASPLPPESTAREDVVRVLRSKGFELAQLGRREEAIAAYDDLLARFGSAPEPSIREHVARAFCNKGVELGELGRREEAIAAYDVLLARFGSATEPSIREDIAVALCNKGVELGQLGRCEEATAACNDLLARYGSATEPSIREHVAVARRLRDALSRALRSKGVELGELGRREEAIAAYDDLLACFGSATEPSIREDVARALCNKGVELGELGRREEAIASYDDLLARFGSATEPSIREDVAVAFCNKGVELGQLGRREEATAACNDLLARYGSATEPSIREHVAVARRLRDALSA
jgi:tetratricopeptide (TPR) repeat protein